MTRKEDFLSPQSRSLKASGVKEVHDMTSNLAAYTLPVNTFYNFFPVHFSDNYIIIFYLFIYLFFFLSTWKVIIQRFNWATICDPAEGPGQFPEHPAMTDALCVRTQEPPQTSHVAPAGLRVL